MIGCMEDHHEDHGKNSRSPDHQQPSDGQIEQRARIAKEIREPRIVQEAVNNSELCGSQIRFEVCRYVRLRKVPPQWRRIQ